jgi:adenine-specific DNA-methyltransferase
MPAAMKKHYSQHKPSEKPKPSEKLKINLQTTTLWEFPSQHYGDKRQGDKEYIGATPSWVIWNCLQRYTRENDVVMDPMCGSGTTVDVAVSIGRQALGLDIAPFREDILKADARDLPVKTNAIDFVFLDPPYSNHITYSGDPACIGELDARTPLYNEAMEKVINEVFRVLKPKRYFALYVCDSFKKGKPFVPIGFDLFQIMRKRFTPVDIISVVRHNRTLKRNHWHTAAVEGNYFLRGFNYLFIMKKP